jgi:AcrR family transcriptional regulator
VTAHAQNDERPSRAPRGTLSADRIVEAAIRVIDADGLDAVTIARLAAELQVKRMSLYTHFRDKSAILRAVAETLFDRIELPPRAIPDVAHLRAVMIAYFRLFTENPVLLELDRSREGITDAEARVYEEIYACMIHLGIDTSTAISHVATLLRYAVGSAYLYPARRGWDEDRDYWERYQSALGSLSPESYPSMHRVWAEFAIKTQIGTYEFGLDTLLDAIAARAADRKEP